MSDEESTQEIEVDALRESLERARGQTAAAEDPPNDRETSRGARVDLVESERQMESERTVMTIASPKTQRLPNAPPTPPQRGNKNSKLKLRESDNDHAPSSATNVEIPPQQQEALPEIEPEELEPEEMFDGDGSELATATGVPPSDSVPVMMDDESIAGGSDNVDLADVSDVADDDDEGDEADHNAGSYRPDRTIGDHDQPPPPLRSRGGGGVGVGGGGGFFDDLARQPGDPAPSLIGTLPGHDVAQALRAMMGEVPDTYERAYREPAQPVGGGGAGHDPTPYVAPKGYRAPGYDDVKPLRDDAPSFVTGAAPPGGMGAPKIGGNALDEGDTQTRLPGDPPSLHSTMEGPSYSFRGRLPGEPPQEGDEDYDPNAPSPSHRGVAESGALPAFALDDDDVPLAAASDPPPAPSAVPMMMSTLSSSENEDATSAGIPTPAAPMEVARLIASEATAEFQGPLPSMARPSVRGGGGRGRDGTLSDADSPKGGDDEEPIPSSRKTADDLNVDASDKPLRIRRSSRMGAGWDPEEPSSMFPVAKPFAGGAGAPPPPSNWDPSEPSSHFPVAKKAKPQPPAAPPPSSPSFAPVDSTELETVAHHDDPNATHDLLPPTVAAFPNPDELPNGVRPDATVIARSPVEAMGAEDEERGDLPRFTLASIPEMSEQGPMPEPAPQSAFEDDSIERALAPLTPSEITPVVLGKTGATAVVDAPPPRHIDEDEPHPSDAFPDRTRAESSPSLPSIDIRISSPSYDVDGGGGGQPPLTTIETPNRAFDSDHDIGQRTALHDEDELRKAVALSKDPNAGGGGGGGVVGEIEALDEAEIMEIVPEELIEDDLSGTGTNTSTSASPPPTMTAAAARPPTHRPPAGATSQPPAAHAAGDGPDAEEQELISEQRWGPLIALYRQRLAVTDGPNKKAAILIKIAHVYETGMDDKNEAFMSIVDAFETAPGNEDVVGEIDRIGKETQRIGELADRVKKKLLPGAPDDKRVHYLSSLVFWYEKLLSKPGSEVSSLISDIERYDKVHPLVLKRAAQLAAMNGDVKSQREHLLRALERSLRREDKVTLHLALASAFAGTTDAIKHYESALTLDPTSIIALQGLKRVGKEKEQYAQVQWALERQAEVAPTEAEKIDALLELAELQESKFLKREAAAELYEQVLHLEPSHPMALKALERCYHAIRDWPRLSRILALRAEHSFDKGAKVELLERAAEVHEAKLGDPAGAVEVYRNLLVVEPKHRRALSDLARLYEKLADWGNVATYKARLAELAPTKRASSQELVKLGDFLNVPDRDPIAAKLQYEKSVQIDPTNPVGWEALQKFAAAEGDDRRVIECLENRKKHTDVPRQRAVVLVELANVHRAQGDDDEAAQCFEAAIRADSSNEAAAVAMLDAYTAEERWAEAAPLCELLVNAAIRDRDGEALFLRLRLATRIAAALGDADRAVTSAVAALDARPKDLGAQADLIAVCSQSPASLPRVRDAVMRVAESPEELTVDLLVRLAGLQKELTELDGAAATLERARVIDPITPEITKELSDVYLAQADFPRACKLKIDMARNANEPEIRFDLLVEAAEIWAKRADELEKGASIFEEARGIKPLDPWLLQTLVWLYTELQEWGLLTGVLDDLASTQDNPAEKMKTLIALAEVVRDRIGDRVRSSDLFDAVIDLDKTRLDIFEEVVRTLTEEKNWERLERSYRKMIARVKDDDEPQLQFLLFHQLGLIYRDRLGDASRAYDALDAASRLQPENAEVRKIVTELLVVTDNLDNAVARIRDDIERDPHDGQLYAELYELFLRQHFFDKAWCAVNVLTRLKDPSPEQRRFHDDYSPMPLDRIPGQIVEQAWRSHIFHADLDVSLTSLFAVMTPAVARMRFGQLRPEQRVGRPFTPTHSRMHDAIRATFNNSSEILSIQAPELLLGDLKSATPFSPALAPYGAILVCGPAVEAQSESLIYLCGKRLAEQRPELSARAFLNVPDLTSLLATAIRVSRQEVAKDPTAAALDASFSAILTPQEREAIRKIVQQATQDGNSLDVKRWAVAADLSSMRAGLLLAGDVDPARNSIGAEIVAPQDLTPREKVGELFKFATSDLYSDLRGAIGVAVQS